jgi:hypothetical protein
VPPTKDLQEDVVAKTLLCLTLIAALVPFAVPQDSAVLPPVTLRENTQAERAQPDKRKTIRKHSSYEPPFCPPRTCLYYAGDFDSTDYNANALYNANDVAGSLEGQAWVGVKPDRDVTVTGATFVEYLVESGVGTNPTPFAVQVGTRLGQAGKTICSTSGNATATTYQYFDGAGEDYAYTIKKLSKPCKLRKGKTYYVNLLPTFENSYGFVMNVEDPKPKNHRGWKNDLNHCFFNGAAFGADYVTCNSQGIGNHDFSELSIALTGKETK